MTDSTAAAEAAATELRDLLREAHGAIKDLRRELKEARQAARCIADEAAREIAASIAEARANAEEPPSRAVPPGVLRCPDCTSTTPPGEVLEHDDRCPLGLAIDALAGPDGSDAEWFREHPDAEEFCRPITATEKAELRAYGSLAQEWARGHPGSVPDWIDVAYTRVLVTRVDDEASEMIARTRKFLT